jgi:hypothetical protein
MTTQAKLLAQKQELYRAVAARRPLRLPLQLIGGAVCGVLIYAAVALMYVIATSP